MCVTGSHDAACATAMMAADNAADMVSATRAALDCADIAAANRRLARHIAGLGMGEFRRQVAYKAAGTGVRVLVADRWFPSSKTCSACGAVRAKLTLAEREFVCESCGTRLDRDYNAALNLAALAAEVTSEPSCGRTENEPAGNPRKTATGGNGYRHGKTQTMSQRRPREVATR